LFFCLYVVDADVWCWMIVDLRPGDFPNWWRFPAIVGFLRMYQVCSVLQLFLQG